ncbi:hypothetical protein ACFS5N_10625 [Mucilaginibacter ximonensis]|uniref:Universal stress protein family protein n=1 Tax=Mucilaginibacter ximonensis TaxID=538021 RepID=A0ABW5YC01_9SPHI
MPPFAREGAILKANNSDNKILNSAECPVIIAPHHTQPINKVLFAFDGSSSALFSIKQFTYLLPELSDAKNQLNLCSQEAYFIRKT